MNGVVEKDGVADTQWTLNGCTSRGGKMQLVEVSGQTFRAGRRKGCDLVLDSSCVSGRHAEIFRRGNQLFLRDLGSTNGTYVNGVRVGTECEVASGDRLQFADMEFLLHSVSDLSSKDEWVAQTVREAGSLESLWVISQFELLKQSGLYSAYQPIVVADSRQIYGMEALARGEIEELHRPDQMFEAARQLEQEVVFSCLCREVALNACRLIMRDDQPLFLNTHPTEDLFDDVLPSLQSLRQRAPDQRIAIEIHEGAVTCLERVAEFHCELKAMGMELAYDDFGTGQTRLRELIEVPPDYIKFDRALITGIHTAPEIQQDLIASLVETCDRVGARTIAEGIEEKECADFCSGLGFDLLQGYFFGHPERPIANR